VTLTTLLCKIYQTPLCACQFCIRAQQHPSADCTCLSKPLQELMVTAVRAVTGEASSHLLCGSDAHSEGSAAGPASDNAAPDEPLHANHSSNSDYSSPQTDRQAAQTSRRVLESAPCSPCRGLLSQPRPPSLQLLSLNVNGLRERQKRAALFAVLQAEP